MGDEPHSKSGFVDYKKMHLDAKSLLKSINVNLNTDEINQITTDGSEHIINGLSDWVYEEEFGFVRAFDWNANGTALVFMQFDETLVPTYSMDVIGKDLYPTPYTFKYPKAGIKYIKTAKNKDNTG